MITRSRHLLLILTVAVFLTACSKSPGNAPAGNANASSNAGAAEPVAAAPTAAALLAIEKKANEAYIKGDGRFFQDILSDKFVMQKDGVRVSKADLIGMISGIRCEAKQGWALTKPQLLKVDNDAYVLSYELDMQGSCTAGDQTEAMPSPLRAATVWIRNADKTGDKWQAAFHGENQIVELKAAQATGQKEAPAQGDRPVNDAVTATTSATADPITDSLMSTENALWDAWKEKDGHKIAGLTAKEIAFVDIFGHYSAGKADALNVWTSTICNVTSFKLTDGVGTSVSPRVGILTLTGTVNGSCGGQDISGQKIHGNTVYVRDGDTWKWVFGFNSPN